MFFFKKKAKIPPITIVPDCVFHCQKEKCPKWVILIQPKEIEGKRTDVQVGKCAIAWIPELMTEVITELTLIQGKE